MLSMVSTALYSSPHHPSISTERLRMRLGLGLQRVHQTRTDMIYSSEVVSVQTNRFRLKVLFTGYYCKL
jgi:hypothetical protein